MTVIGTARVETREKKQVLVLEIDASNPEGFKDDIRLFRPSQELKPEGIAVSIIGFVEEQFLTMIDNNLVAFYGARSDLASKLTTRNLAEALRDKTFHFQTGRT